MAKLKTKKKRWFLIELNWLGFITRVIRLKLQQLINYSSSSRKFRNILEICKYGAAFSFFFSSLVRRNELVSGTILFAVGMPTLQDRDLSNFHGAQTVEINCRTANPCLIKFLLRRIDKIGPRFLFGQSDYFDYFEHEHHRVFKNWISNALDTVLQMFQHSCKLMSYLFRCARVN